MGTWGTTLFEDDIAADIRDAFNDDIQAQRTVVEATKNILTGYSDRLADSDEGPLIYLILAKLQLNNNDLDPDIAAKALEVIKQGTSLSRWREIGGEILAEREKLLTQLEDEIRTSLGR